MVLTRDVMRPIFVEDPAVAEHLSQALTRHHAKSKEAIEHLPGAEPDAVYPAATLLTQHPPSLRPRKHPALMSPADQTNAQRADFTRPMTVSQFREGH